MKKAVIVILVVLGALLTITAQESMENKKGVYLSDDNKLYVNKNLGVYLWLSTSPDEQAGQVRLLSDSSKRYTNPMYFDTEGYNTVRSPWAVDTVTKRMIYPPQDIVFKVYADGLPPVSKVKYESKMFRIISGKKYYGSDLHIEIRSHDAVSGVQSTYYSLNSTSQTMYNGAIKNFEEGKNSLKYFAVDKVGNREEMKDEIFYIDTTPPETVYTIDGNPEGKHISANAKIKLESTDNLSGVKAIYYCVNSGTYRRYYNPLPISLIEPEENIVRFYAEDQLGNKEIPQLISGKNNEILFENY